jgi:hypothetical protein
MVGSDVSPASSHYKEERHLNGPEIQLLAENDLRRAILRHGTPRSFEPIRGTPWVSMSLLQKALRRGQHDLAMRAAATLLRDAPDRLWGRLGCIASEDIGLGGLDAVGMTTAALAGNRLRMELGGDWAVASCIIGELSRSKKCRAADDPLMISETHPRLARERDELRGHHTRELLDIVISSHPVQAKAVALSHALGGGRNSFALPRRRSEAMLVFDCLCEAGWPHSLVEMARLGYRRTGEMLSPLVALLFREPRGATQAAADDLPPEQLIGEIPSWAYDLFSREGRACFARFLQTDAPSAIWLRRHVSPGRRVAFLGHMVFRAEGGLVDHRMHWPLADQLRREADVECSRPECVDAGEILGLVRDDISHLNEVRANVLGSARYGQ